MPSLLWVRRDLRRWQELGRAESNAQGGFEIPYRYESFRQAEGNVQPEVDLYRGPVGQPTVFVPVVYSCVPSSRLVHSVADDVTFRDRFRESPIRYAASTIRRQAGTQDVRVSCLWNRGFNGIAVL